MRPALSRTETETSFLGLSIRSWRCGGAKMGKAESFGVFVLQVSLVEGLCNVMQNEIKESLEAELEDTLDEDYKLEISEPALAMELRRIYKRKRPSGIDRKDYFRALLTLHAELIKLQDWVQATGEKILVIFRGARLRRQGRRHQHCRPIVPPPTT
jgi:hypothetical protein